MRRGIATVIAAAVGLLPACGPTHSGVDGWGPPELPTYDAAPAEDISPPNKEFPPLRLAWTQVVTTSDGRHLNPSVALHPNGTTGLFSVVHLAPPVPDPDPWAVQNLTGDLRTFGPDGVPTWSQRAAEPVAVEPTDNSQIWQTFELRSWSTSFVLLRRAGPVAPPVFSFECQVRQNPEDVAWESSSRASFFDSDGRCIRELGLGKSVYAFAANPAGEVWYQYAFLRMSPSCPPPRKVNVAGVKEFDPGDWEDENFDASAQLQGPFTRFVDGRLFGVRGGRNCGPGDGSFGLAGEDFRSSWTSTGVWETTRGRPPSAILTLLGSDFEVGPFDVGSGDFATVARLAGSTPTAFGGKGIPTGGFVALRYDAAGTPKEAMPFTAPFEGGDVVHLDAEGIVFSSPAGEAAMELAAIAWDGTPRWRGSVPCPHRSSLAAHPEHGLRVVCPVDEPVTRSPGILVIAIDR
jgi:hypothetical protein